MSKVVPGEVVPGEVVPGEVVDVESPPAAVVDAQPPANEYGGVVEGHVVAVQPQKVHPEPRPQEDILAKRCECERRCECGIRPKRPTKKDGKPDYGFRWDGEVGSFSDQAGRVYSICISACVGLPGVGAGPARGIWGLATAPSPLGAAFG